MDRGPGYLFTEKPLGLPAGHYGLGHGSGAHAPDEYLIIEASNPKVAGFDAAVNSHVAYLETLAGYCPRCRSVSSSLRTLTTLEMRPRSMAAGGSIQRSRSIRSTKRSWGVPVRSA